MEITAYAVCIFDEDTIQLKIFLTEKQAKDFVMEEETAEYASSTGVIEPVKFFLNLKGE